MRITSGLFGGRRIAAPKTLATRPTQENVREALFSMLQGELSGKSFLDLFAGTGAVGLEALSRGAAEAAFVENARPALAALRKNIEMLRCGALCSIAAVDVWRFLSAKGRKDFDFVFADPPYEILKERPLETWIDSVPVAPGGFFILEMRRQIGRAHV